MTAHHRTDTRLATRVGELIGIDLTSARFDVAQFRPGIEVELEHGARDPATDVTGDNPVTTGKIALAHLNEFPDYDTRLKRVEDEDEADWQRVPPDRDKPRRGAGSPAS